MKYEIQAQNLRKIEMTNETRHDKSLNLFMKKNLPLYKTSQVSLAY
jgi:hypothetical protein